MSARLYMVLRSFTLFLFVISAFGMKAQVSSVPAFPIADESVTIRFNAQEGSGGLAGYSGDVYVHIGVITSASTSSSDWQNVRTEWGENTAETKLTRVGSDLYQISLQPSIRDYFELLNDVQILQIAMVFRSAVPVGNSYLEGKTSEGGDLFVEIFENNDALSLQVIQPTEQNILIANGATIDIKANISTNASVVLYDNGTQFYSATNQDRIDESIVVSDDEPHTITIEVSLEEEVVSEEFTYLAISTAQNARIPDGLSLGLNLLENDQAILVLEAPNKENVLLLSNLNDWKLDSKYWFKKNTEGKYFWTEIDLCPLAGEPFIYQYIVDAEITIADPFAELVLDARNDGSIPTSTFPDLPAFPDKANGFLASVYDQFDYDWSAENYTRPNKEDLVVYELLMRDFLESSSYSDLIDTIPYLKRLGVNAVEFMPIGEFEGNDSWGYNPSFHGAVDKYYGSPQKLKEFIDECHKEGIAVILDVVFNHVFSQSPLAQLYWDQQNFRPTAENPWLNVEAKHPFNVGYDVDHEAQATKDWMDQLLKRWVTDYRFDGFRFDLSKGFTQVNNPNNVGAWGNYDASRIALLKRMADELWNIDPESYVILEHLSDNDEEKELAEYGMLLWGNLNHNYSEASMGYTSGSGSDLSWALAEHRGWQVNHAVSYMESHDEERLIYRNITSGNSTAEYNTRDLETALDRVELSSALFYTLPGPKMLWQFGEVGYPYSINRCTNGSVDGNCRLSRKPIEWDLIEEEGRSDLFKVTQDLIHLKTNFLSGLNADTEYSLNGPVKWIVQDGERMDMAVIGNFDITDSSANLTFPSAGKYYEYFSRDSIEISNPSQQLTLLPGEYRVYLSEKIDRISGNNTSTSVEYRPMKDQISVEIFPNPISSDRTVNVLIGNEEARINRLELIDIKGNLLQSFSEINSAAFNFALRDDISVGIYLLNISTDVGSTVKKLTVTKGH